MKKYRNTMVDKFGRIVIPKELRDDLDIESGTVLSLEERGDSILLSPLRQGSYLKQSRGVIVYAGRALGDLVAAERMARRKHLLKRSGWKNAK
jgi:AbrB family looped-hinge helix DNA binding protein